MSVWKYEVSVELNDEESQASITEIARLLEETILSEYAGIIKNASVDNGQLLDGEW